LLDTEIAQQNEIEAEHQSATGDLRQRDAQEVVQRPSNLRQGSTPHAAAHDNVNARNRCGVA